MTKLLVIDLDQTIIDSSIRENLCYPYGSLCLDTYNTIKPCPDMGIINDCLTPFGAWLKENYSTMLENGYTIVFLTARLCDRQDLNSFKKLNIDTMLIKDCLLIERGISSLYGGDPNEQHSGRYKKPIMWYLARVYNTYNICVIDDCPKVISMAKEQGFTAICARDLYHYNNSDFVDLFNSL